MIVQPETTQLPTIHCSSPIFHNDLGVARTRAAAALAPSFLLDPEDLYYLSTVNLLDLYHHNLAQEVAVAAEALARHILPAYSFGLVFLDGPLVVPALVPAPVWKHIVDMLVPGVARVPERVRQAVRIVPTCDAMGVVVAATRTWGGLARLSSPDDLVEGVVLMAKHLLVCQL